MAAALLALLVAAAASFGEPVLRALGSALVVSDPAGPADLIVVSLDAGAAGALEASDLVRAGVAVRVAVFEDPPGPEAAEFARRAVPYEDAAARQIRQLNALGVQAVVRIPLVEVGSHAEANALRQWCRAHPVRRMVVVSTTDHSRRLRRLMLRSMQELGVEVGIRPSRYSEFDPDAWWKSRTGRRIAIVEWQKLILDFLVHPLPS